MNLVVLKPHHQVPSLLLDPPIVRVIGRGAEEHSASAYVDEREAVGDSDSERGDHVLGEEIAGHERVEMEPDELPPGRFAGLAASRGGRRDALFFQDPTDRGAADSQAQRAEFADDPAISPASILLSQAKRDLTQIASDSWPPDPPRLPCIVSRYSDTLDTGLLTLLCLIDCRSVFPDALTRTSGAWPG